MIFPYDRIINIDKGLNIPVYRQIAVSIINAIRNGVLKAGVHLPGSREIAKNLGVYRKTILSAYAELNAQD